MNATQHPSRPADEPRRDAGKKDRKDAPGHPHPNPPGRGDKHDQDKHAPRKK